MDNDLQDEYQSGFYDGFEEAKKRIVKFLSRFPLQTAALLPIVQSLHPSQYDEDNFHG